MNSQQQLLLLSALLAGHKEVISFTLPSTAFRIQQSPATGNTRSSNLCAFATGNYLETLTEVIERPTRVNFATGDYLNSLSPSSPSPEEFISNLSAQLAEAAAQGHIQSNLESGGFFYVSEADLLNSLNDINTAAAVVGEQVEALGDSMESVTNQLAEVTSAAVAEVDVDGFSVEGSAPENALAFDSDSFGESIQQSADNLLSMDASPVDPAAPVETIDADSVQQTAETLLAFDTPIDGVDTDTVDNGFQQLTNAIADVDIDEEAAVDAASDSFSSLSSQLSEMSYGTFVDEKPAKKAFNLFSRNMKDSSAVVDDKPVKESFNFGESFASKFSNMKAPAFEAPPSADMVDAGSATEKLNSFADSAADQFSDFAASSGDSINDAISTASRSGGAALGNAFSSATEAGAASISKLFGSVASTLQQVPGKVTEAGTTTARIAGKAVELGASGVAKKSFESVQVVGGALEAEKMQITQGASSTVKTIGDSSLTDIASSILTGIKFMGGILIKFFDLILNQIGGTSVSKIVQSAQTSVMTVIDNASHSVTTTIHDIGNMTIQQAIQNMIALIIAVANLLLTVVNAIVKLLSGKEASEWVLAATSTANQQAHDLSLLASNTAHDLTHKSLGELSASIGSFSQHVGNEIFTSIGSLDDAVASSDGATQLADTVSAAVQMSLFQ